MAVRRSKEHNFPLFLSLLHCVASPKAWLGRIIADTSASTYWRWNESFPLKQMWKFRIQGVEGKGGVPVLISCDSPYAMPFLPIHEFCPYKDAGITFFIFIYPQTSILIHACHKYSNEEEWGWMAKQSDWPLSEWLVFGSGSSTDVPVSHCTLTAPGAHSALYSESTDNIMDRAWS